MLSGFYRLWPVGFWLEMADILALVGQILWLQPRLSGLSDVKEQPGRLAR
jgi:hypothetical protein